MQEIPLFPLQTVLFPGAPLRLHIFEDRYKRMINDCIARKSPVGIVLIRHGREALGPLAEPYTVGTLARILQVQQLPDGRMNIVTVGDERFKIISLESDLHPYLVGYIEPFPLAVNGFQSIEQKARYLRELVDRYLHSLSELGAGQYDMAQFPEDPVGLAYMAISLLQMNNQEKQNILEIVDVSDLIEAVVRVLQREVALARVYSSSRFVAQGAFSIN